MELNEISCYLNIRFAQVFLGKIGIYLEDRIKPAVFLW